MIDPYKDIPDTNATDLTTDEKLILSSELGPAFMAVGANASSEAEQFLAILRGGTQKFNQNHDAQGRFASQDEAGALSDLGLVQNTLGMGEGTMNSTPTTKVDPNMLPVEKIAQGTYKQLGGALGKGDNPRFSTVVDGQKYFVKALEGNLTGASSQDMIENELTARGIAVELGLSDQTIPVATFSKDGTDYLTQPWQTGKSGLQIGNYASIMRGVPDELAGKMAAYEYLMGTGDRHAGQYVMDPKASPDKRVLLNDFDMGFDTSDGTSMNGKSAFMSARDSAPITDTTIDTMYKSQEASIQIASDNGMNGAKAAQISDRFDKLLDFKQNTTSDRTVGDLANYTNYY